MDKGPSMRESTRLECFETIILKEWNGLREMSGLSNICMQRLFDCHVLQKKINQRERRKRVAYSRETMNDLCVRQCCLRSGYSIIIYIYLYYKNLNIQLITENRLVIHLINDKMWIT